MASSKVASGGRSWSASRIRSLVVCESQVVSIIFKGLKIELTLNRRESSKSPLTPLFQRGELLPLQREVGRDFEKDVRTMMRPLITRMENGDEK
jgi:hypothetical protein